MKKQIKNKLNLEKFKIAKISPSKKRILRGGDGGEGDQYTHTILPSKLCDITR